MSEFALIIEKIAFLLFWLGFTFCIGLKDPYPLKKSVLLYRILNLNWYCSLFVTAIYVWLIKFIVLDSICFLGNGEDIETFLITVLICVPAGLFWLFWRWIAYKSEFGA